MNTAIETDDNVIPFAIPVPKPDGKFPTEGNWLSLLPVGWRFFTRFKNTKDFGILDCTVAHDYGNGAYLLFYNAPTEQVMRQVDTKNFSIQMEKYADIGWHREKENEEQITAPDEDRYD